MKTKKQFLGMSLMVMTLAALVSACSSDDDDKTPAPVDPTPAGVVAIDLGLPSGTKWANMNVGASKVEDYGDYFAWGETEPYYIEGNAQSTATTGIWKDGKSAGYDWASYTKFGTYDDSAYPDRGFTKYTSTNGPATLEAVDDAATANWGYRWRMPTYDDCDELFTAYPASTASGSKRRAWLANYNSTGVAGLAFYDASDNILLFLPAAGVRSGTSLNGQGTYGIYWSSSLYEGNTRSARDLYFDSGNSGMNYGSSRCSGCSVRPVLAH